MEVFRRRESLPLVKLHTLEKTFTLEIYELKMTCANATCTDRTLETRKKRRRQSPLSLWQCRRVLPLVLKPALRDYSRHAIKRSQPADARVRGKMRFKLSVQG